MALHAVFEDTMEDQLAAITSLSFANQEAELLAALDSNKIEDEDLRKRYVIRLFDRFRMEYTCLSMRLRESLRNQRQIMEKCQEMKNQLVLNVAKVQTQKKIQEEENKTLAFYRQECEHAWKEAKISQMREKEAMRIIEELKEEIDSLQLQVNTLLNYNNNTATKKKQEAQHQEEDVSFHRSQPRTGASTRVGNSSADVHAAENAATSPHHHQNTSSNRVATSPSKTRVSRPVEMLSFEDWKAANRVWSPADNFVPKAETPTIQSLQLQQQSQQLLAKSRSAEVLYPTPMQRAIATAIPSTRASATAIAAAKTKRSAIAATPTRNICELPHV